MGVTTLQKEKQGDLSEKREAVKAAWHLKVTKWRMVRPQKGAHLHWHACASVAKTMRHRFLLSNLNPYFFTSWSLCSKFDAAGRDIKYPIIGIINAVGSVRHDEIGVRIGVPGPKGITAFH